MWPAVSTVVACTARAGDPGQDHGVLECRHPPSNLPNSAICFSAARTRHSETAEIAFSVHLVADHFSGWLGSRVVSMLDSGAEGTGFKSQPRRCRVTVLDKLLTRIVPLFTKQQNWQQPS